MFIGQYDHSIDDKSRLTLPARFRDALADGVVLSKGLDGSVDVYPKDAWQTTIAERIGELDPLSSEARTLQRLFFGGAAEDTPDKQGRVLLPAHLIRYGSLVEGRHGDREQRSPRDLGSRRLGGAPGRDRRECRPCCRTSCRTARLTTPPSSRTRCAACSPCSRARRSSMPPSAPAATRACSPRICGAAASSSRSTAIRASRRTSTGSRRRPGWTSASSAATSRSFSRSSPTNDIKADAILLDIGVSSMQIDRPERGFSYATDAPLDMRMDPSGEVTAATIVNTWDEKELATIFRRFGEERYAGPIARAIARRRAERAFFRTARSRRRDQDGDPDAGSLRRGASRQARLPGAADRGQRRARPARGRAAGRRRDAAPRRSARRDQLPLARGPDREAVHGCRREGMHLPARLPDLRLRQGAGAAPAHAKARPAVRRRARPQPPGRLRAPPRRGEDGH